MKLVPVHVICGAIAIASGLVALYARKGGTLHRKSGTIFACAMLIMSLSGAVMAIGRPGAAVNIPAGLVTAYLVTTSFATVRSPFAGSRWLDRGAMVAAFVFGVASITLVFAGRNGGLTFPLLISASSHCWRAWAIFG
jgi:uncharacterized membrane protein